MKTAVVRTWLVYFFTLLSVALLNIDGVVSWVVNKGEGREEILRGLGKLKHLHKESGIGPWLVSLECAAGPAFEGSYKDKSKCRDVMEGSAAVSWKLTTMGPSTLQEAKPNETQSDPVYQDHTPPRVLGESAPTDQVAVMHEPDGATPFYLTVEASDSRAPAAAVGNVLEKPARASTEQAGSEDRLAETEPPIGTAVPVDRHPESSPAMALAQEERGGGDLGASRSMPVGNGSDADSDLGAAAAARAQGIELAALHSSSEVRPPVVGQNPDKGLCGEELGKTEFQSVLLVGDSLAHGLALSLGRDLKDRRGAVFSFVSKVSSGLNNPGVFNWEKTMRMLIEHGAPDLVLVMMGVNDANNHIREGNRLCAVGTPEWGQAYENRVENFLRIASENRVQVCWIGVPVVREEVLQNRVLLANMAARNACGRVSNCRFIDTFEVLCDENRKYTNYLKEPDGSCTRIRSKDGIHFSMEGSNLLSRHILQKLEHGGTHPSAQN
jgi:hypothetical protein